MTRHAGSDAHTTPICVSCCPGEVGVGHPDVALGLSLGSWLSEHVERIGKRLTQIHQQLVKEHPCHS
jgi:hypothetical protein